MCGAHRPTKENQNMIGYVTLGTSDLPRAAEFCDAARAAVAHALRLGGVDEGAPGLH